MYNITFGKPAVNLLKLPGCVSVFCYQAQPHCALSATSIVPTPTKTQGENVSGVVVQTEQPVLEFNLLG